MGMISLQCGYGGDELKCLKRREIYYNHDCIVANRPETSGTVPEIMSLSLSRTDPALSRIFCLRVLTFDISAVLHKNAKFNTRKKVITERAETEVGGNRYTVESG